MPIILYFLNFVDWATTVAIVRRFGFFVEANPFVRGLMEQSMGLYTAIKMLCIIPAQLFFWHAKREAEKADELSAKKANTLYYGTYTIAIVIYFVVVLNNLMLLNR